ncbi:uncharacterized protein DS421_10g293980 [Arachis hypogaea]|nr:uncharacterized protein DS421_10g293980 [Arachis hypogaea]
MPLSLPEKALSLLLSEIWAAAVTRKLLTELLPGRFGVAAASLCYCRVRIRVYWWRLELFLLLREQVEPSCWLPSIRGTL